MMVASNKRVLVVDDESIVCDSYESVLTKAGFSVRTARSGRDALAACRGERFDVMLTDLKMPDMDGLEVTREVKKEFPQVQVLIITGYPTEQSAARARGLGVFDYLSKPLSPERLSAATAAATATPAEPIRPAGPAVVPAPEETVPAAVRDTEPVEPGAQPADASVPESALKTLGMLALAPLIGVVYVMFLPLVGFGMLLWILGMRLAKMLGWERG